MPRRYLFTVNNPTQSDIAAILGFINTNDQFRFCIYQGEYAPTTHTPHLQGYVEIEKNQRITWFKSNFSDRANFTTANGTSEQNVHYCSKPVMLDTNTPCMCKHCKPYYEPGYPQNWLPVEKFGQPATDLLGNGMWESVQNMVAAGAEDKQITEQLPVMISNLNKLKDYRKVLRVDQRKNPNVKDPEREWRNIRGIWIYGPSSSGKSQAIWELFPNLFAVGERSGFDEYSGEAVVLWDDFDPKKISFKSLLRYLDKYPVQLDCRFHNQWARYNDFFFTHINPPGVLYHKKYDTPTLLQLLRRVDVIKIQVQCSACGAEAEYNDRVWSCKTHSTQHAMRRVFWYKKVQYSTLAEILAQIPYRI